MRNPNSCWKEAMTIHTIFQLLISKGNPSLVFFFQNIYIDFQDKKDFLNNCQIKSFFHGFFFGIPKVLSDINILCQKLLSTS